MWVPSVDVFELIVRGIVVYLVLFALLRFIGKKHVGELSPFDFVVLLITSGTPIRGKKKAGPDWECLPRPRRANAGKQPFYRHAAGEAEWHDKVMRHERCASPFILGVGISGNSEQQCHFVYRITGNCPRMPNPCSERRTILPRRNTALSRGGYRCSAAGSRHFELAISLGNAR